MNTMIAPTEQMSTGDAPQAEERYLAEQQQQIRKQLDALSAKYEADFQALLGTATYQRYQEFRAGFQERLLATPALDAPTASERTTAANLRQNLAQEGRSFINSLRVDQNAVKTLQKDFAAQAQSIFDGGQGDDDPQPANAPQVASATTAWTTITPPYSSYSGAVTETSGPGTVTAYHFQDNSGRIWCTSHLKRTGAGNSDLLITALYSRQFVKYQMPVEGSIEVQVTYESDMTLRSGSLTDEFGFSDAYVIERSEPYIYIFGYNGGMYKGEFILDDHYSDGDNMNWSSTFVSSGNQISRTFKSSIYRPFAANRTLDISVAVADRHFCRLNDMSADVWLINRWTVKNVKVRAVY